MLTPSLATSPTSQYFYLATEAGINFSETWSLINVFRRGEKFFNRFVERRRRRRKRGRLRFELLSSKFDQGRSDFWYSAQKYARTQAILYYQRPMGLHRLVWGKTSPEFWFSRKKLRWLMAKDDPPFPLYTASNDCVYVWWSLILLNYNSPRRIIVPGKSIYWLCNNHN